MKTAVIILSNNPLLLQSFFIHTIWDCTDNILVYLIQEICGALLKSIIGNCIVKILVYLIQEGYRGL